MGNYKSCAKVEYGSIYSCNGCIIENPALVIDEASGTLLSWGEQDMVEAKYIAMTTAYAKVGLPVSNITLITMDNFALTREEQCYIIRRCVEYSASGFQASLCREIKTGKAPKAWLAAEMARVPINVSK